MTRSFIALVSLVSVGALSACSPAGQVSLGVNVAKTGTATSAIVAATGSAGSGSSVTSSSAIVITRVRILVNKAKLGKTSGGGDSTDAGPFVIDLSKDEIANGAHRDFSIGALTAGTYDKAEIEIEPLDSSTTGSSADLADFVTSKASLLVDGTYKGVAFQFAGHFKAEQGKEGSSFAVAAGKTVSIAMDVAPETWFVDASGNDLDPTDATQHSAIAVAICHKLDTETEGGAAASGAGGGSGSGSGSGGGSAPAAQPAGVDGDHHGGDGHGGPGGPGGMGHCVE